MSHKLRIGVLFGGRSAEHEVSLVSATSVIKNLDKKKYVVVPVGISQTGEWGVGPKVLELLKQGKLIPKSLQVILLAEPGGQLIKKSLNPNSKSKLKLDAIFPVLHGTLGEDGTVQGLLELTNIPYVGCGVLGSAVGMDKITQKMIFQANNLPTPKFLYTLSNYSTKNRSLFIKKCLKTIKLPCFIKPANLGSSVGISKAHNPQQLKQAINIASRYDQRIIIEQSVERALEIECAVLGNNNPQASVLGQIVSSNEFYDYNAKYVDGKSQTVIPARLPKSTTKTIRALAIKAFKVLNLSGLARVDFLLSPDLKHIYLNEVNTMPGFTSISMYPKLWAASGLTYPELLDKLIQLARERQLSRQRLKLIYKPKTAWYQN